MTGRPRPSGPVLFPRSAGAVAAILLAAGCARAHGPRPGATSGPAPTAQPGLYGPEPRYRATPLEAQALAAVRARLPGLTASPALSLAAREIASRAASGAPGPLSRPSIRAALARALAWDPAPSAFAASAPPERIAAALAAAAPVGELTHAGIGIAERGGAVQAVLLGSRRMARLEAFPRDVTPGTTAELRGALRGLSQPRVFATGPGGRAREVAVRGEAPFVASISFGRAGRWLVEVLGRGPQGPQVAALLVVSAGGAPLDEPERPGGAEPADPGEAEARVVEAVNALRARHGLAALEESRPLRDAARRHSSDMLAAGTLAHALPGSGDAAHRLRRDRIPFRAVRENLALGPSALAAQDSLEESPAHLANLLDPAVTRIGAGIARGRLAPGGEPIVYLTEILVQPVDDSSDSRLRPEARVKEALWRERERLGRAPLLSDPPLDELAGRAARAMLRAGEPGPGSWADDALALGRKVAAVDTFVAAAPGDAARSKNLADPRHRRVGVGVAVGDSARYGSGLLWIAVIYTD